MQESDPTINTYLRTEYGLHGHDEFAARAGESSIQNTPWISGQPQKLSRRDQMGRMAWNCVRHPIAKAHSTIFDRTSVPVYELGTFYTLASLTGLTAAQLLNVVSRISDPVASALPQGYAHNVDAIIAVTFSAMLLKMVYEKMDARWSPLPVDLLSVPTHPLDQEEVRNDMRFVIERLNTLAAQSSCFDTLSIEELMAQVHQYGYQQGLGPPSTMRVKTSTFPRKMYREGALGENNRTTGEIAVGDPNDMTTIAHETVHSMGLYDEPLTETAAILAMIQSDNPACQKYGYLQWLERLIHIRELLDTRPAADGDLTQQGSSDILNESGLCQEMIDWRNEIHESRVRALDQKPTRPEIRIHEAFNRGFSRLLAYAGTIFQRSRNDQSHSALLSRRKYYALQIAAHSTSQLHALRHIRPDMFVDKLESSMEKIDGSISVTP